LLKSHGASLSDKKPLLPEVTGKNTKKTSASDTRLTKKELPEITNVKASVSDQQLAGKKLPDMTPHPPNSRPADNQKVPSLNNKTLRYMAHHFPASSRESSAMVKSFIFISYFIFVILYFIFDFSLFYCTPLFQTEYPQWNQ